MKILAFGASTSSQSINRQLASYAAHQFPGAEVTTLDLSQYDLPVFSVDAEEANDHPADARAFLDAIRSHDAVIVSLAEHNGSYTAAFKNLYDWASRIESEVWGGKPMLLLSTSPGARGGASVMESAKATFPRMGADVRGTFSLPSFHDAFSPETGIADPARRSELAKALAALAG